MTRDRGGHRMYRARLKSRSPPRCVLDDLSATRILPGGRASHRYALMGCPGTVTGDHRCRPDCQAMVTVWPPLFRIARPSSAVISSDQCAGAVRRSRVVRSSSGSSPCACGVLPCARRPRPQVYSKTKYSERPQSYPNPALRPICRLPQPPSPLQAFLRPTRGRPRARLARRGSPPAGSPQPGLAAGPPPAAAPPRAG
ncbi:hypothetical protein DAEQUDRAFT_504311 [Daedalea quercina L-15889]|uniref:Uncharacterized protein n=1 Tax=Daedalea quercina L-15889 TaxID=1314783 RepID=A0A165T7U2_9APHY|nr:hypothetical protein DAEQUDRAFT_504311 [Daedalea quercina L-15889]